MILNIAFRLAYFVIHTGVLPSVADAADGLLAVQRIPFTLTEYHVPDPMLMLLGHSAMILALAALACAGLGLAIFQRTRLSSEILVLELMIASITGYFALLAFADSLPVVGAEAHRMDYILRMSAQMVRAAFFMFSGHFLASTYRRTLNLSPGEKDATPAWMTCAYAGGFTAIGYLAFDLWRTMHRYTGWNLASPPLPNTPIWDFLVGMCIGVSFGVQVQILSNLYSQVADEERQASPLAALHLSSLMRPVEPKKFSLMIGLILTKRSREERLRGPLFELNEWKAFLVLLAGTFAGSALFFLERTYRMWGADYLALWRLKMELLPLVILFPLVYYKTRFLFFDVIIKRGLIALTLLASAAILAAIPGPVSRTLLWCDMALFAAIWAFFYRRLDRALDRYLFNRPDYEALGTEIAEKIRTFADPPAMIAYVTERLHTAMRAPISFSATPSDTSAPVGARGYLVFGDRPKLQPYQSGEMRFIQIMAGVVASAWERMDQARRERELREFAVRAELKALRAQINPHFFFNALNTVADLTQSNPAAAEKAILNLAGVFQFALEATKQETIPLGREIAFVRSYLEIEKARFEEKLNYEMDVPDSLHDLPVPPMLIQPLVENAVRHGVSPMTHPGHVIVRARLEDNRLWISVEDDGMGFDPTQNGAGVGLANVEQRVERLAGAGHWHVESTPGVGTRVRFDLEALRCAC